jgi:signal peptidase II
MKINNLNLNFNNFDFKLYLIITFLILLDQFTKYLTENVYYELSDFLKISFSLNTGSAFGIFSNLSGYNYFIIILSLVILVMIHKYRSYFYLDNLHKIMYVFIFSGIIGNLLDRILLGGVRDFIYVEYFSIFNFADVYLSLAAILIVYVEFIRNKK